MFQQWKFSFFHTPTNSEQRNEFTQSFKCVYVILCSMFNLHLKSVYRSKLRTGGDIREFSLFVDKQMVFIRWFSSFAIVIFNIIPFGAHKKTNDGNKRYFNGEGKRGKKLFCILKLYVHISVCRVRNMQLGRAHINVNSGSSVDDFCTFLIIFSTKAHSKRNIE